VLLRRAALFVLKHPTQLRPRQAEGNLGSQSTLKEQRDESTWQNRYFSRDISPAVFVLTGQIVTIIQAEFPNSIDPNSLQV
jgi:hypothetical protein